MRALRTRRHTYIFNLAHEIKYPIAGDVASSPSWKAITAAGAGLGKRPLINYLHRPPEELYDVVDDPEQVVNLAGNATHRDTLHEMRSELRQWRAATQDPWLEGQTSPFEHSH
jgi:N-sulfoglucosamine sulfohydrolase